MTTTLTRRRYAPSLPGRRDGALIPAGLDLRPCATNPPQWWDTGNPNAQKAIDRCNTCPFKQDCTPADGKDAAGTIRAGIAYDDNGQPAAHCPICDGPMLPLPGQYTCVNGHGSIAGHHHTIVDMLAGGATYTQVAAAIGVTRSTIRRYWTNHLDRDDQPPRIPRLPGVPDGCTTNRPADWHEPIETLLSDLDAAYTYQEVAYAVGSTTESVKAYWLRLQRKRAKNGQPTLCRRSVSNRGKQHLDPRQERKPA